MYFRHHEEIWRTFPRLAAGTIYVAGIEDSGDTSGEVSALLEQARARHGDAVESELPPIQAWRRAFATMGLKPTQYRCASESLLRRLRKDGTIPPLHPLVDLCNAVSILHAIPIAVFDLSTISGYLEVRRAEGDEIYTPFSGPDEVPEAGEVVFADGANRAHARRWTNRQSGYSAVRPSTSTALIVAEALHEAAAEDMRTLIDTLRLRLVGICGGEIRTGVLSAAGDRFEF
jgi:DNA/RNA-binding domain of Phe-tRNA-synthetase-like protein